MVRRLGLSRAVELVAHAHAWATLATPATHFDRRLHSGWRCADATLSPFVAESRAPTLKLAAEQAKSMTPAERGHLLHDFMDPVIEVKQTSTKGPLRQTQAE